VAQLKFKITFTKKVRATTFREYEGWNFNSDNYLFTTDTK